MGTVGLSFGSATSGAGFDVSTTVSNILAIQQGIETPWKTQLTALQAQDTAFSMLGTDLSTLSTRLQALTDFDGILAAKEGASSDTSVISLSSASADATAGSHDILVNSLAQTSSVYTTALPNSGDTLSGSVTIQIGSGTPQTVTIDNSSNTLSSLAAAINSAGIGVTASLISDTTGTRLSLVSSTSGSAGQLTVSSSVTDETAGANLITQTGHIGKDASLTVDGIDLTSASNTVSTAIPGVTFQLLATSSNAVQVQISNDITDISSAIQSFVTAYNAVITDITTQEGKDSSGTAEPLSGDPTIALLQTQLGNALVGGSKSGSISSLSQLGITVGQDGTLTYSSSTGIAALNSNFSDIEGFLQNSGSFGDKFSTILNGLSPTLTTGAIYLAKQQNATSEGTLNKDVSDEEARIAEQKTSLTAELNSANQILQSIPSQLSEVDEMYSAVTGYNSK